MLNAVALPEGKPSYFIAKIGGTEVNTPFWQWATPMGSKVSVGGIAVGRLGQALRRRHFGECPQRLRRPDSDHQRRVPRAPAGQRRELHLGLGARRDRWPGQGRGRRRRRRRLSVRSVRLQPDHLRSGAGSMPEDDASATAPKTLEDFGGARDLFVARIAEAGSKWRWVTDGPHPPQAAETAGGVAAGTNDQLYVVGDFNDTTTFGSTPILDPGRQRRLRRQSRTRRPASGSRSTSSTGRSAPRSFRLAGAACLERRGRGRAGDHRRGRRSGAAELLLLEPAGRQPPGGQSRSPLRGAAGGGRDQVEGELHAHRSVAHHPDRTERLAARIRTPVDLLLLWRCGAGVAAPSPPDRASSRTSPALRSTSSPRAATSRSRSRSRYRSPIAAPMPPSPSAASSSRDSPQRRRATACCSSPAAPPSRDLQTHPPIIQIVRTLPYDTGLSIGGQPVFTDAVTCEIGEEILEPTHEEHGGKNGFVIFDRAYFDGDGADRAYDRTTRLGQIVPVNQVPVDSDGQDLMAVAWYRKDARTVAWPVKSKRYDCRWPADPDKIIIASELGSEVLGQVPLDPLVFTGMRIYNQPDPAKSGFNPNDEHAIFAPANSSSGFNAHLRAAQRFHRGRAQQDVETVHPAQVHPDRQPGVGLSRLPGGGDRRRLQHVPVLRHGGKRRLRALSGAPARQLPAERGQPERRRSRTTRTRSGRSRPAPWSPSTGIRCSRPSTTTATPTESPTLRLPTASPGWAGSPTIRSTSPTTSSGRRTRRCCWSARRFSVRSADCPRSPPRRRSRSSSTRRCSARSTTSSTIRPSRWCG